MIKLPFRGVKAQTAMHPLNGILFNAEKKSGIEFDKTDCFFFVKKKKSCSERQWPVIPTMGYVGEEEAVIVVEK